jgi:hypothetical protein
MKSRLYLIGIAALFLTSCATYFTRKGCEKTNWFQYGQSVAMSGTILENDSFISECRRVEAEINESALDQGFKKGRADYCEPTTSFAVGKRGDLFAASMCDGANIKLLQQKYAAGVREYCQPSNGETAGSSGKAYRGVCPAGLEAKFLPEYKKGRKKYLQAEVETREHQIRDLDREIIETNEQRTRKVYQLAALGGMGGGSKTVTRRTRVAGGGRGQVIEEQVTVAEDPAVTSQRDSLKFEVDNLERDAQAKRESQSRLREEIRKLRAELLAL